MEEIAQHTSERALRIEKKGALSLHRRGGRWGISGELKVVASKGQEVKETTCQSFLLL